MAEQVGYANPYRFQHLLGRAQWNADAVCAEIRQYAVEHLKSQTDILAIDETGNLYARRAISRGAGAVLWHNWTFRELPSRCIYVLHQ